MGYVYLIEDINNNTFKIGVTKGDVNKRLKKLQTGNSTELRVKFQFECEYPYRLESMLHNHYKETCELNEWFGLSNPNEFLDMCIKYSNIIDSLKDNPFFNKQLR
jgi:hypothetical protein